MKLRTGLSLVLLVTLLSSCVQYELVPAGMTQVGPYQVELNRAWNKSPAYASPVDGAEVWTLDGIPLNSIVFYPLLGEGDTLIKGNKSNPFPAYQADMLPTDIQDWVERSLAQALGEGGGIVQTSNLQPIEVAGTMGFMFDLSFSTAANVDYLGRVLALPQGDKLGVIVLRATRIHYFDEVSTDFEAMIRSLQV